VGVANRAGRRVIWLAHGVVDTMVLLGCCC